MNAITPLRCLSPTLVEIQALFETPLIDLLWQAQNVHRSHFDPHGIQLSTLLSIKTGGCPEDCGYCPQSVRYETGVTNQPLMPLEQVISAARAAKAAGASRFCMGAAWRSPKNRDLERVVEMIQSVKALGLETCATLGMLEPQQADRLKDAGLDFYNHNIDTAREYYSEIIHTRDFEDRLKTIKAVRQANIQVCCGGIIGMGETRAMRAGLLWELTQLDPPPESVPINLLVQVEGTPLSEVQALDHLEFVRTIACARILLPQARVRLSAGREHMSSELQTLCFMAGANSIFYGEQLLTTNNPAKEKDQALFATLGLHAE